MTSIQQRAELQRRIWAIANEVRGAVDGWDFKQYVLGTLFYRFISENFANYLEGGDDSVNYAALNDAAIPPDVREDAIKRGCAEFCVNGQSIAGASRPVRKHHEHQETRRTRRTAVWPAGQLQEA